MKANPDEGVTFEVILDDVESATTSPARQEGIIGRSIKNHHSFLSRLRRARMNVKSFGGKALKVGGAIRNATAAAEARGFASVARLVANPVGLLVGAAVVAGTIAVRLGTGLSFQQMGENLNEIFLGGNDDEARAKSSARSVFTENPAMLRAAANTGITNDMSRLFNDIYKQNLVMEKGASLMRQKFGVNNTLDILILQAEKQVMQLFNTPPDSSDRCIDAIHSVMYNQSIDRNKSGGR